MNEYDVDEDHDRDRSRLDQLPEFANSPSNTNHGPFKDINKFEEKIRQGSIDISDSWFLL